MSGEHDAKWRFIEPSTMSREEREASDDYKEWSVFVRDWFESRNLLIASCGYAALLFLWYFVDSVLKGQASILYVIPVFIFIVLLAGVPIYVEKFYSKRDDQYGYYGKYYDDEEREPDPSVVELLLWPRTLTYLVDIALIILIVAVEWPILSGG
jgi:hypothetical protein